MGLGEGNSPWGQIVRYLLFIFNFIFWLVGGLLIGLGVYGYVEKDKFYTPSDPTIYDFIFDVSIIVTLVGALIFVISFLGCVGALRENVFFLKGFCICLVVVFFLELVAAILAFVFSSKAEALVTELFQVEGLLRYRDDADFMSFIDWFQETVKCCGVGKDGYKEWSVNPYFNCSDTNPSVERCSVPYSCCLHPNNLEENMVNTACGRNAQRLSLIEAAEFIHTKGCVKAVLDLAKKNLHLIGGIALGVTVPQLLGIMVTRIFIIGNERLDSRGQ